MGANSPVIQSSEETVDIYMNQISATNNVFVEGTDEQVFFDMTNLTPTIKMTEAFGTSQTVPKYFSEFLSADIENVRAIARAFTAFDEQVMK